MLILTLDGYINSADIVRVTQGRDHAIIKTRAGDTWRSHSDAEAIVLMMAPVIPALPGYTVLTAHDAEEGELFVTRSPVVAWRILDDLAVPVTPDTEVGQVAVLFPDGQVVIPGMVSFKNEEAWLKYRHEERDREDARRKTLAAE